MGADGSTIRVYLNVGTDSDPRFTEEFQWAQDTEGTIMEVPQWCCIGFTPMFYGLDDDGYKDMITGQYHPGAARMPPYGFKGSYDIFSGRGVTWAQPIEAAGGTLPGLYEVGAEVTYQTCKDDICLLPQTETVVARVLVQ